MERIFKMYESMDTHSINDNKTVYFGKIISNGVYSTEVKYDVEKVKKLILSNVLAPFYEGIDDYSDNPCKDCNIKESSTTEKNINNTIIIEKEKDITKNTTITINEDLTIKNCSNTTSLDKIEDFDNSITINNDNSLLEGEIEEFDITNIKRNSITESQNSLSLQQDNNTENISMEQIFKYPIQCPICYLYYPRNINYTHCCDQPICTECFTHLKRKELDHEFSTFPIPPKCPFCSKANLSIYYLSPKSTEYEEQYKTLVNAKENNDPESIALIKQQSTPGKNKLKKDSPLNEHIITCDNIYTDWLTIFLYTNPNENEREIEQRMQYTVWKVPFQIILKISGLLFLIYMLFILLGYIYSSLFI